MDAAWIGYSDNNVEGTWQWVDVNKEGLYKNYKNWQNGEPNNNGAKEDCGVMRKTGMWNDFECVKKLPFFCEFSK